MNRTTVWPDCLIATYLVASAALLGGQARAQTMVSVDGIGRVPAKIVLACEQATGDGGHESFYDAEWEFFSDCVHDELDKQRRK